MKSTPSPLSSFIKILFLIILSWTLLILTPMIQFGAQKPYEEQVSGELVPLPLSGLAVRGSQIYEENGCASCHTQQTRNHPLDSASSYGKRATVTRDLLYQPATVAGFNRWGPDLSNIGERKKSADWHHQHLFSPQSLSPESIMPSYSFLYEKRKIKAQPSSEALKLPASIPLEQDEEVIPTSEAKALVAYLLSLNQSYPLPESPLHEDSEK